MYCNSMLGGVGANVLRVDQTFCSLATVYWDIQGAHLQAGTVVPFVVCLAIRLTLNAVRRQTCVMGSGIVCYFGSRRT